MSASGYQRGRSCGSPCVTGWRRSAIAPKTRSGSVEVRAGQEFLGTLHRDEEDGEVSFSLHITMLKDDLPTQPGPKKDG
jgi:hypothetical protein